MEQKKMSNRFAADKKTILLASLVIMAIVLVTPRYLDLVVSCGHSFVSDDMATDYLKGVLWAMFLGCGILLWPVPARDKLPLICAWLGKMVVALGLMLMYEERYDLDAANYFYGTHTGDFSFADFKLTDGTANMINLARMHYLLFPDSYHAMKVSFAMLGLIGVYFFYRGACIFMEREETRVLYLLAFFPGILFWSSILGKDPLVFLGIAMYSFAVVGWLRRRRARYVVPLLLGIALATFIRQWLAIIMILPLAPLLVTGIRGFGKRLALAVSMLALLVLCAGPMVAKFKIAAMSDVFEVANTTTKGFVSTAGGSTQQLDVDLTSASGMVTFLPVAAFTALFRPLPGEVMNPFGLLAGAESSVLLYLLLRALRRTTRKELSEPLVLWAVSFLVIWALLNGIVSSANFGVAVRYKLQVLPLLLGVLIHLSRKRTLPAADPSGAESAAAARDVGGIAPIAAPAVSATTESCS